jgi:ABC-2 type transport system permease protein
VIADATDPNIANTITNYVNAILQNRAQEINKANQPIKYKPKLNCITIRNLKVFYLCAWRDDGHLDVSISMMTSISITVKKELTMEIARLPFKPSAVILGKVFPIFLSMINANCIVF